MVDFISTLGLQVSNANNLTSGQTLLSKLSQQLTTGKYSTNLSDYSASDAQKLVTFTAKVTEQEGFLRVSNSIKPRLDLYNTTLEGIEDSSSNAYSALLSASTYNVKTNASLQSQIEGYLDQMEYYLNQKIGDRYLYSGARYSQAPVTDLGALPSPPTETAPYLVASPAVPPYDIDYDSLDPTASVPEAHVQDQLSIDTTQKLTYGITSNEDCFQQVIMGLRWAYAATQDPSNYTSYMQTARDLLTDGLANVRGVHTDAINALTTLKKTEELVTLNVSNLKTQVDAIEGVDVNEVAVKITTLQAQLEASYSVTGKILSLSLVDYI